LETINFCLMYNAIVDYSSKAIRWSISSVQLDIVGSCNTALPEFANTLKFIVVVICAAHFCEVVFGLPLVWREKVTDLVPTGRAPQWMTLSAPIDQSTSFLSGVTGWFDL
jgi:hypothetical protein